MYSWRHGRCVPPAREMKSVSRSGASNGQEMTITTSYFNQSGLADRLDCFRAHPELGIFFSACYLASREEPYQVAEAMPVSAMQKFMSSR